jgi:hypothetical protein
MLEDAVELRDLASPPGNRLEARSLAARYGRIVEYTKKVDATLIQVWAVRLVGVTGLPRRCRGSQ